MNEDTVRIAKLQDLKELQNLQIDMEHTIEDEPYPDKLGKLGVEYILNNPEQGFYLVAENSNNIIGALRISFESDNVKLRYQNHLVQKDQHHCVLHRLHHQ